MCALTYTMWNARNFIDRAWTQKGKRGRKSTYTSFLEWFSPFFHATRHECCMNSSATTTPSAHLTPAKHVCYRLDYRLSRYAVRCVKGCWQIEKTSCGSDGPRLWTFKDDKVKYFEMLLRILWQVWHHFLIPSKDNPGQDDKQLHFLGDTRVS